jgi:hypothetical protein
MDKLLVNSEQEYMDLFSEFDLYEAEKFMGVEFAFEDGTYQDNTDDESQNVSKTIYRKRDYNNFPESYPCIVLLANDKDFDRTGTLTLQILEFIYPADFVK